MKNLVLGVFLLTTTNVVFAQADFDYKAEREKLSIEIDKASDKIQLLYKDLYDDQGNEDPAVRAKIDLLTSKMDVDFAKAQYLWTVGFEGLDEKYRKTDVLKHFKKAKNRFASVTAKDSKGQIISHESAGDMINDLYDKDIAEKYGCYANGDDDQEERSTPYEEDQEEMATEILSSLGYANYKELEDENYKAYCAIDESNEDVSTIIECNDFISGVRLSLLETLENKVITQAKNIKKIGYFNATDESFLRYELVSNIKNEVEDQITNVEAACLDKSFKDNDFIFGYLEDEVQKDGITIEYTNFSTETKETKEAKQE